MSMQLATHLHVLIERSSTQLVDTKVKSLEKSLKDAKEEIARLKTDLGGEARGLKTAAEGRDASLKKEMAKKAKEIESLLAKSEAAAKEDAQTISKLKADLASAESSAVKKFCSSLEFETAKLEFASSWVFDTVSQCRRLVKEKLGTTDLGFLAPIEIA
jgi:chromosome segregation ATPase